MILGEEVHPGVWHYVFSGDDVHLVPSDGFPFGLTTAQLQARIPRQKKKSNDVLDRPQQSG